MEPIPFHQWKAAAKEKESAAGRAHEKDWYWSRYGAYCAHVRRVPQPPPKPINEIR